MNTDWQTFAALAVVALAAAALLRRIFAKRREPGCSSCPPDKFKTALKR